jgi:beta-phosphoglucomutase family hydrolase
MFSAVIFDLDGVVADTHPVHKRAWRQLLTELGHAVSEEDLDFVLEGRRRDEILRFFLGDLSDEQVVHYGHRKDSIVRSSSHEVRVLPGIVSFLEQLERQKLPTAVATSAGRCRTQFLLGLLGLVGRFSVVVTGEDVEFGKPHPAIFLLAAKRLQVHPESILVVEDSPAGVQAAKAAGMKCLGIASGPRSQRLIDAGADQVCIGFLGLTLSQVQSALTTSVPRHAPSLRAVDEAVPGPVQ